MGGGGYILTTVQQMGMLGGGPQSRISVRDVYMPALLLSGLSLNRIGLM